MAVYLDYNATAPLAPQAKARMQQVLEFPANPSSIHAQGREAKKYLEDARNVIAAAISVWPDEIVFTATATEANTTALRSIPGPCLVSAIEHSSVLKARTDAITIPATSLGTVDLIALEELLKQHKQAVVSVMLANNETGVIQPMHDIAALCKKHGALLHCDAVQGLGKIPIDCGAIGADLLTLTSHKCGGPVGAAALVVRRNVPFVPLLLGGGQEGRRRAGTENVAAVAGFAAAVEVASDLSHMKSLRRWLDTMEEEMLATRAGIVVFGKEAERLPNTSCVAMPNVSNEVQLMDFDLKGFAVSAGSACSSGRIEVSHVLTAMGFGKEIAGSAIRVSAGWQTTEKEIQQFTENWKQTCLRLAKAA